MDIHFLIFGIIFQLCSLHLKTILSQSCLVPTTIYNHLDPEYYWKDYTGTIPYDAIEAGTNGLGNPTYIGQAYFEQYGLLPVIIFIGCRNANATAHTFEISTDKNIKILCSHYKQRFEWIPTKNNVLDLQGRHLVVGGYEIGHTIYFGRVQHDGKVVTGKVFTASIPGQGLWIPYQGKPINFKTYEILTYNYYKPIISWDIHQLPQ